MTVLKICVSAAIVSLLALVVKKERAEYALVIETAGVVALAAAVVSYIPNVTDTLESLSGEIGAGGEYLKLLLKVAGTAVTAEVTAAICRDSGSSALAVNVETAAKLIILAMCMPLLKSVALFAFGLLS